MTDKLEFDHPFLDLYLDYVEETESPRIFHVWAALTGVGACLGRKVFLPFGLSEIFANQYVLLVGPPAVRKSSALGPMQKAIRSSTPVRFAPKDTGGQRQGLLKAMADQPEQDDDLDATLQELIQAENLDAVALGNLDVRTSDLRDRHCMFAVAGEFNSFLGTNSTDMITFLVNMWDGEDYDYKTKNGQTVLKNPLLSFIGGTTPTNIATAMPVEAIGHGFMSRIILVYASKKYKSIAWPEPPDEKLKQQVTDMYGRIYRELDGPMETSPEAYHMLKEVYEEELPVDDPRFIYYKERRHTHLLKLSMCVAAARLSKTITLDDVELARAILMTTERNMPDALGEYGMSPLATAKQEILEYIRSQNAVVPEITLWGFMNRHLTRRDFVFALSELISAGRIVQVQTNVGPGFVFKEKSAEDAARAVEEIKQGLKLNGTQNS